MLNRNEKGKLVLKTLDIDIFFSDLFAKCKTESEIEFLRENLISYIDNCSEERQDEIYDENFEEED